jgi:hypothetical protein
MGISHRGLTLKVPHWGGGDFEAPTVILTTAATSPHDGSVFSVTATFSEDVTGFVVGDLALSNCTASNFVAVSATVYTLDVTLTGTGSAITVQVPAGCCIDGASNPNVASNVISITVPYLSFAVTTTSSPQTVTLQQITPSGANVTCYWGDTASSAVTDGNVGTTAHSYAAAGTYTIRISNPAILSVIDLRDSAITFNSSTLLNCGTMLDTLFLSGLHTECVINSADMAHLTLSIDLYLLFSQAGTYTINSAHFAAYTLSSRLFLLFSQAGTYTINSVHFAAYTLSTQLRIVLRSTSTTATIARADWSSGILRQIVDPTIQMGLTSAQVDDILLGAWDDFANRTASNGTFNIAGTNAAPTGTLQAQCPPTTGKEAAYELVNDSCGVSANHYAAVTLTA